MDIEYIKNNSAESELIEFYYDGTILTVLLRMYEPEIDVKIAIPTSHVFCPSYHKNNNADVGWICYLDIVCPEKQLSINQDGIIIPPSDFKSLMKELKDGYGLAYGIHVNKNPRIIRFTGYSLLACVTYDIEHVQVSPVEAASVRPISSGSTSTISGAKSKNND